MATDHVLTPEELFCLEGCRSEEQYNSMRKRFEKGICTFCELDPELNKVIWEDEYVQCWPVHEKFLRSELKRHFIIIPRRHLRFEHEMSDNEILSVGRAQRFIYENYPMRGGVTVTRFGDMSLNSGTVPHLHINVMEPSGTGEVRIPVVKLDSDREKNQARAAEFAKRYEAGERPR